MGSLLTFVGGVMLTFVAVWLVIFGGTGALLARARGGTPLAGFIWGAVFGPLGWGVIWTRTRGTSAGARDWIDAPPTLDAVSAGADEREPRGLRF